MDDIISNILIGVNPKVTSRSFGFGYTATYNCSSNVDVSSPVTGTITDINGTKVTIKSNSNNTYTINGCNASVTNGTAVSSGTQIGTTSSRKITLESRQNLSSLESTTDNKKNSVNDTNSSDGQIGLNTSEIQGAWDTLVGKPIAISNIPYDVASKRIKRAIKKVTLKNEYIDIKDNVLSEELKRIKSLF